LLTGLERKAQLAAAIGAKELIVIPFDRDFSQLSAGEFVERVLVERLGASSVAVGENFRFGHGAQGDARMLAADPRFATAVHPLLAVDGQVISSTRVRELVAGGDVDGAQRLLGAPFQLRGIVVEGDRRGRELGFPTANIVPDPAYARPGHGVYAARCEGRLAAVNVGLRPTFSDGQGELVEVHLLDFDGDLYGRELHVDFVERLRGEQRFDDVAQLVEQMGQDITRARTVLQTAG
jgi:riboflavin kinase/FMN adenylyltransferase